ncbi:hypothetical protein [Aeromicrobium stalagmiti]|nr:hypothetical protein [Aeromicrobium stalagmiti]
MFATPDLCDAHPSQVRVMEPILRSFVYADANGVVVSSVELSV